jgi:hypothetical protein
MSPTEAKLDSAALRIFFNFLTLGPNSQYGSIFCSKTNTITFTVTDRELLGMEVWREDIVAYAHKKGVLYFLEHHTVIPLRVRLHYTAFVTFAVNEANHNLVSCEGMGPCEARAKKVMPCLCNECCARVHTWLVNTKRARAKHSPKAVRTANECGTPVLLNRL